MVKVRDIKKFAALNEDHLVRFFHYKTGISDPQITKDYIQEFYLKLSKTGALENYDEKLGPFNTYVMTFFCWILYHFKNKNFRKKYKIISDVKIRNKNSEKLCDIWEFVNNSIGPYRIDVSYSLHSSFEEEIDISLQNYLKEFKEYIKRTESKHKAHQMIVFLDNKKDGCMSRDIARMLGVSDNMVKIIKKDVRTKFDSWKKIRFLPKKNIEPY